MHSKIVPLLPRSKRFFRDGPSCLDCILHEFRENIESELSMRLSVMKTNVSLSFLTRSPVRPFHFVRNTREVLAKTVR
jgi:hypothetical protein